MSEPDWKYTETRFRRAGKGNDTIHLATCRLVEGRGIPWIWAEVQPIEVIAASAETNGLRLCKVCKPTGGAS